jgi:hypothetical protein
MFAYHLAHKLLPAVKSIMRLHQEEARRMQCPAATQQRHMAACGAALLEMLLLMCLDGSLVLWDCIACCRMHRHHSMLPLLLCDCRQRQQAPA